MGFKELQALVRSTSSEMNAFFKSGGTVIPDKAILQNYKELTIRILNGSGGAPASKLTETSLTDVTRPMLIGVGNRLLLTRKRLFLHKQARWRVTSDL